MTTETIAIAPGLKSLQGPAGAGFTFNAATFGAKGDGATDDTDAIQDALDACRLAGGGSVFFPAGVYLVTIQPHPLTAGYACALCPGANTTLVGEGMGASIIRLAAGQVRGNDVAENNSILINYRIAAGGDEALNIRDLCFDGNAANQTHCHGGINLTRVRHVNCTRVRVLNCRGTSLSGVDETFHFDMGLSTDCAFTDCQAIGTAGSTASGYSCNSSSNVTYAGCIAFGMTVAHGFSHNTCQNLKHLNCHSFANGCYGYNSESSVDVLYNGCIAGGDTTNAATYPYTANTNIGNGNSGFLVNASTRVQLIGCICRHNNGNGLNGVGGSSGLVIGGEFTTSQYGGFSFDGPSLGLWSSVGRQINTGNGQPQYLDNVGHPVFGPVTAPSVPASTVAHTSIYPQDATVHITGGNVSAIAIGGTATGLTSGTFRLPPGQTIAIAYAVAPSWTWFLG